MESIPYDKRSGKFGSMEILLNGRMRIFISSIMDFIILVVFLKERVYDGEIFKLEGIQEIILLCKKNRIKVPYSKKKLMMHVKI